MAVEYFDLVEDYTATAGTGPFTLYNETIQNRRSPAAVLTDGDQWPCVITHMTLNEWQTGTATYLGSNQFEITTPHDGSSGVGVAVSFSPGVKHVRLDAIAHYVRDFDLPGPQGDPGPTGSISGAGDGTVSAPSIAFASDTNTGLYRPAADTIGVTTGGTERIRVGTTFGLNLPSAYTPTEFAEIRNNADADAFIQLMSGIPSGTDRRMYFSWKSTDNVLRWHFGKNPGNSIILFDHPANTHRMQLNPGTSDGATHITSGGTGVVEINGFGESGTGSGGFRVWSGTASPSVLLRTTSGGTIVGGNSIEGSAVFQADSTTKGLLPPRMTTAQRTAIGGPAEGLTVFDTDLKALFVRSNSAWKAACAKQYYCLVHLNNVQQSGVATATYTKVNLTTEVVDADAVFDSTTNYRYTAPETGLYYVRGSVGSYNGSRINAYIYKNGANTLAGSQAPASSIGPAIVSGVLSLTAGDYLELYAYQDSGSTDQIWGNTAQTNFSAMIIR